jgi:hypothetical protein
MSEERDEIYRKYHAAVNMTHSELKDWAANPCSRKASLDRAPINRNLELLSTKKSDWTEKHLKWANKTIAFIGRMSKAEQGKHVSKACQISRRDISLKNWAYDPGKSKNSFACCSGDNVMHTSDDVERRLQETTEVEFVMLEAIATDNLPNRSGMRIPAKELQTIAATLPGKLAIKDHRMGSIDTAWGRISKAWIEAGDESKLSKTDRAALNGEGYQVVHCYIAVPADHPELRLIEADLASELSITFTYSQLKCPGCDCGKDIYPSWGCPRSVSAQPYLERHGVTESFEISLVVVPAVKAAHLLK